MKTKERLKHFKMAHELTVKKEIQDELIEIDSLDNNTNTKTFSSSQT